MNKIINTITNKNIFRNNEFIKTLFIKSMFRKLGFFSGFLYGINQNVKINNIELYGFNAGLVYGSIGLTVMGSAPLWFLMNIYFFHNHKAFILPDVILKKYKPKCEQGKNNNNNDSLFLVIL